MFMIDYKQLNWWYWFVSACLLTAGVAGYKIGFDLVIGLTLIQLVHFTISEKSISAFTVQVRFVYLLLMIAFYPEPIQFMYWLPLVGTWARVTFGYCLLARTLCLLPWNRQVPFSTELLMKAYFSRPVRGNILQGLPPLAPMAAGVCGRSDTVRGAGR